MNISDRTEKAHTIESTASKNLTTEQRPQQTFLISSIILNLVTILFCPKTVTWGAGGGGRHKSTARSTPSFNSGLQKEDREIHHELS